MCKEGQVTKEWWNNLKPASPVLVVGYTFHRLLVAQLGTMVTPSPNPTATHRMNRLRLVKGSIEMTYARHCNVYLDCPLQQDCQLLQAHVPL